MRVSPSGTPLTFAASLRQIAGQKRREAELEKLVARDELTGLANLSGFLTTLTERLERFDRRDAWGACIVFGVDGLQMINRGFGFAAGQHVLLNTSTCIRKQAPSDAFLARLGDDRFGVVLAGDSGEAKAYAEAVLRCLRSATTRYQDKPLHFTVSAGISAFPGESVEATQVLGAAEAALADAKSAGRDRVMVYDATSEEHENCKASLETGAEIRLALEEGRLRLAYQPVIAADGKEVRYYEGLLRMVYPDGRIAAAGEFITVAERFGLIRAIDRGVMELAIAELAAHPEIHISINLSGVTATDHEWLECLTRHLKAQPEIAKRLIVEITETAAMHDLTQISNVVDSIRELGCRVALDDFGAGFTTFRHLRSLSVDIVKIDRSFVSGAWRNEQSRVFLQTLLSLSKSFGLESVAEGVEEAADAEFLAAEGFDCLQGWYFGRPQLDPEWRKSPADAPVKPSEKADSLRGEFCS
jgi:diguanylate cyclase (GGDEF)-like protein